MFEVFCVEMNEIVPEKEVGLLRETVKVCEGVNQVAALEFDGLFRSMPDTRKTLNVVCLGIDLEIDGHTSIKERACVRSFWM